MLLIGRGSCWSVHLLTAHHCGAPILGAGTVMVDETEILPPTPSCGPGVSLRGFSSSPSPFPHSSEVIAAVHGVESRSGMALHEGRNGRGQDGAAAISLVPSVTNLPVSPSEMA